MPKFVPGLNHTYFSGLVMIEKNKFLISFLLFSLHDSIVNFKKGRGDKTIRPHVHINFIGIYFFTLDKSFNSYL